MVVLVAMVGVDGGWRAVLAGVAPDRNLPVNDLDVERRVVLRRREDSSVSRLRRHAYAAIVLVVAIGFVAFALQENQNSNLTRRLHAEANARITAVRDESIHRCDDNNARFHRVATAIAATPPVSIPRTLEQYLDGIRNSMRPINCTRP